MKERRRKNNMPRIFIYLLVIGFITISASCRKAGKLNTNSFEYRNDIDSLLKDSLADSPLCATISLDSLIKELTMTESIKFVKQSPKVLKCDTVYINRGKYKITREIGKVKQTIYYDGVANKDAIPETASSCWGEILIDNHFKINDEYLVCIGLINEPENNKIEYGQQLFSYYVIEPDENKVLTTYASTNNTYLIFADSSKSPYMLNQNCDMWGLEFGDVNKDGNLDFLDINPLVKDKDILKLSLKDKSEYESQGDIRGLYYIIKVITYKDGKWQPLMKEAEEVYIIIKLKDQLDSSNGFKILSKNW